MRREIISIVTGWSDRLGSGHIQRMTALADFLERQKMMRPFIIADPGADPLPSAMSSRVLPYIQSGSSCIIRDMRDSTIDEVISLKRYCRVITIDDCGPGRDFADLAIDLLPNLEYASRAKRPFIYGYNFTDSIRNIGDRHLRKTIDCAVYPGNNPSHETVDFLFSLIPPHASCALLCGDKSLMYRDGASSPLTLSYAEALLSSKVLISHFGITLYEGHIAGCRLVSVNPTDYHSSLADQAVDEIGVINLGTTEKLDPGMACTAIAALLGESEDNRMDPVQILAQIDRGLEQFYAQITPFLADVCSAQK